MKTSRRALAKTILALLLLPVIFAGLNVKTSYAEGATTSLTMSPMRERVTLNPGDSYKSAFKIRNPETSSNNFSYRIYNQPYYRNENNEVIFENVGNRSQILDWLTIDSSKTGTLEPGETRTIEFSITVPENAPAGGQYATITVGSDPDATESSASGSALIKESVAIGYTIFAEITGTTIHQGEVTNADVPSFLFFGNISGSSVIKNTGNTHSQAYYKLQVFPLFSDEEIYTNEENPDKHLILPDRTVYSETVWKDTPLAGIFNVKYTVEFEGTTTTVSKLVIICPVWLLFIIVFAILALVVWVCTRIKKHRKIKESA